MGSASFFAQFFVCRVRLPINPGISIKITLIKDLSEWSSREQDKLFTEICEKKSRFFLISNTGSLLALFRRHADKFDATDVEIEGKLLTAMDSEKPEDLTFRELHFKVYNLALRDNIDIAMALWRKLIAAEEWEKCTECAICKQCPIYKNFTIISKYYDRIHERLRLMLKRTSEYGGRLTMRQLSAHFSYMLCSGYNCAKIREWGAVNPHLKLGDFLFFNHFFGDNADGPDVRANQLRSVHVIREQGFETLQAPCIERYLWLKDPDSTLSPNIPELKDYYEALKKRVHADFSNEGDMTIDSHSAMARRQIRRMFYFLYEPAKDNGLAQIHFGYFKSAFLNSPMLLEYEGWRKDATCFNNKRTILLGQIFQVLQEQFSGIRLPERGVRNSKNLYVTLARRQHDIRQSAQIVLGKIGFNEAFMLKLENGCVYLVSKKDDYNIRLELALPFLDYIANRKNGGIGTILQLSYIDRLENLKNKILKFAKLPEGDGMVLLKQNAGHELLQQRLHLEQDRLEVSND